MELRILSGFLACLVAQAALLMEGPTLVALVAGKVERVGAVVFVAVGALALAEMALMSVWCWAVRAAYAIEIGAHVNWFERTLLKLAGFEEELQVEAADELMSERVRRNGIVMRGLYWHAPRFLAASIILALFAVIAAVTLISQGWL